MENFGSPKPKKLLIRNEKSFGASEKSGSPTPSYSRVWQQLPKTKNPKSKLIPVDFSRSALSRIAGSRSPQTRGSNAAAPNAPTMTSDQLQELITKHNPYNYETAQKKIPLLDLVNLPEHKAKNDARRNDFCGFHTERLKGTTNTKQELAHQRHLSTV